MVVFCPEHTGHPSKIESLSIARVIREMARTNGCPFLQVQLISCLLRGAKRSSSKKLFELHRSSSDEYLSATDPLRIRANKFSCTVVGLITFKLLMTGDPKDGARKR